MLCIIFFALLATLQVYVVLRMSTVGCNTFLIKFFAKKIRITF
jgi:hypothetical protein